MDMGEEGGGVMMPKVTTSAAGRAWLTPRTGLQTTKMLSLVPSPEVGVVVSWAPITLWGYAGGVRNQERSIAGCGFQKHKWKYRVAESGTSLADCIHQLPLKSNQNSGKMGCYGSINTAEATGLKPCL